MMRECKARQSKMHAGKKKRKGGYSNAATWILKDTDISTSQNDTINESAKKKKKKNSSRVARRKHSH